MHPHRRCSCDRQRVLRRRARVGGLCRFRHTAERVPAWSKKAHVAPACGSVAGTPSTGKERLRATLDAAAAKQEKRLGAFLRQLVHVCPQCGQF